MADAPKDFRISVIVPAYNRADLLPRTVASVAAQTLAPYELIIVDDESSDDTPRVCADLAAFYEGKISVVYKRHDKNKGEGGARNTGIQLARGNYLAFLDSDDEWMPEKLERQVEFLQHSGADGVFCETFLVDDGDYARAQQVKMDHEKIVAEHLFTRGCGYGTGTNFLVSREAVAGDLFDESMRLFIDLDWLYRVAQRADLRIMHEALTYYHKAPMRTGEYISQRVEIFMSKHRPMLAGWPAWKRLQVYSCMNWYIAHAYAGNGRHLLAARHFALGIAQNPVRNPRQYLEPALCLFRAVLR